ncbi:MAG: MFS transporter [Alphaproteobacteria bacterium]|nr:MFS transporter [Alphaproteobacteria bacterium]
MDNFSEIRSGWRLLLSAMLGTGLGLPPLLFYSIGIFAPILAKEFGWSFASIFGGLSLMTFTLLLGGPLAGHFVDRYGARKVAAISLSALGISYMTLALSSGSIVQYYASWLAMAVFGLGATPISFTEAISSAFVKQRGLALGITLAGVGLFVLSVKPLANWLLNIGGWRVAIVGIGLLPLMVGTPAVLWGFPVAQGIGVIRNKKVQHSSIGDLTLREALRTRTFWILIVALVPMSFASAAPFPNMENILRSVHISPGEIVALSSLIGIAIVTGRLIGGWLIDRIWAPLVGAILLSGASLGAWILSQHVVSNHEAMLAIILLGLATGVELSLVSYLVGRYFGFRSYGVIYGALFGVFAVGAASGPSLLGYAYDRAGSYSQIMQICALLFLCAAGMLIGLGRYPVSVAETTSN